MKFDLFSLNNHPPPGFEYRASFSRGDFRLRAFALFADSIELAEKELNGLVGKIDGIIVTYADSLSFSQKAPFFYHLGIPEYLSPYIKDLLAFFLDLLETQKNQDYIIKKNALELSRSFDDRQRLANDFALSRQSLIEEISERKSAEKALREVQRRLEMAIQGAKLGTWDWDIQNGTVVFNDRWAEMLGFSLHEIEPNLDSWKLLVHPEDMPGVMKTLEEHVEGRTPYYQCEYRLKTKSGGWKWVLDSGRVFERDRNERPLRAVGVHLDITERKLAEAALRESEEKYRLVVDTASEAIFVIQDGFVKFPNKSLLSVSGYTAEELKLIPFQNCVHPDDRRMVLETHIKRLRGEEVPTTYAFRTLKKSGETVWTETSVVTITWEGRPATLNFIRDITRQKKLEEQLLQAQKMEAVGTLAGGIAHDFNNLLMGILGYTSLMLLHSNKTDYSYDKLKRIEQMVESGAELTKQLLGFARGGKYEVRPTDINKLIKESSDMFGRTKKEVVIHRKLDEGLYTVEVDRGQIEQVLINLYVNAWHAMPAGGDLYLETRNAQMDERDCAQYDIKPGAYIKIIVTDTGIGMDQVTQQRVFEPFFTTKEMGRGTGLGLASAYGIIRNHGGVITVYSEKGHGASFSIYLPALGKDVAEQKKRDSKIIGGDETLLLVDDEKTNLNAVAELLKTLGYRVLRAQTGLEAIEIFRSHQEDVELIILDMIMPGMSGGETFERLKEIKPDIKVILSSGYSINGQADKILKMGCQGFIQKPFHAGELSQKIREALDR